MNVLRCLLIFLLAIFTSCSTPSPAVPEGGEVVPDKDGVYLGTYKKGNVQQTIAIVIYKDGVVEIKNIIYPDKIDVKSSENPITVTHGEHGYTIDFVKMTATSIAGTDKGFIYQLVKEET